MRIIFDVMVILACIYAPWMLVATLLIIGLLAFNGWAEGIVATVLLDIILFGGMLGLHTVYIVLGFCAIYYVTIRFKETLRVS